MIENHDEATYSFEKRNEEEAGHLERPPMWGSKGSTSCGVCPFWEQGALKEAMRCSVINVMEWSGGWLEQQGF